MTSGCIRSFHAVKRLQFILDYDDVDSVVWAFNLKGVYIRALLEARARNPGTDLARYIEAYTLNQARFHFHSQL